jgi:hypothetical protein
MGAFLQIDLRALWDTLHDGRPAAWPGAHRYRRSRHRQFGACRRDKGHGKPKPKTKTPNHLVDPVVLGQGHGFNRITALALPDIVG